MIKRIFIIPVLVICLLTSGCTSLITVNTNTTVNTKEDISKLKEALTQIFIAYNSTDSEKANEIAAKYISPEISEFTFGETGLNRLSVDGIWNDYSFLFHNFTLDDYNIDLNGTSACITGCVNGSVSRYINSNSPSTAKEFEKGPWKLTSFWIKNGDNWQVKHSDYSKLAVPELESYTQLPAGYDENSDRKWPLILFLHGVGERGYEFDKAVKSITSHSIPHIAMTDKNFQFVVVSPLCPSGTSWVQLPYSLNNVVDETIKEYNIDTGRIYLTGLSMGGMGTWSLAMQYPERFAAIAPVCGRADPAKVDRIKNVPVWAFHGARDPQVPIIAEQRAVDALKACGGDVKFTIYPDVEHDAWNKAYATKELYDWFLQHTTSKK